LGKSLTYSQGKTASLWKKSSGQGDSKKTSRCALDEKDEKDLFFAEGD
jgi:hypothetical protein